MWTRSASRRTHVRRPKRRAGGREPTPIIDDGQPSVTARPAVEPTQPSQLKYSTCSQDRRQKRKYSNIRDERLSSFSTCPAQAQRPSKRKEKCLKWNISVFWLDEFYWRNAWKEGRARKGGGGGWMSLSGRDCFLINFECNWLEQLDLHQFDFLSASSFLYSSSSSSSHNNNNNNMQWMLSRVPLIPLGSLPTFKNIYSRNSFFSSSSSSSPLLYIRISSYSSRKKAI